MTFSRVSHEVDRVSGKSFDAVLFKTILPEVVAGAHTDNWLYMLEIELRVKLVQINPNPAPFYRRSGQTFWIRHWTASEWSSFIAGAKAQADMWNNKFVLKPPLATIDFIHVDSKGLVYRPYVKCELRVVFSESGSAHTTIEVANLDTTRITGARDGSTFRSHSLLWDSLDTVPWVNPIPDNTGAISTNLRYTIAHELGHSLGLGHIGELKKTPLCQMAIALEATGHDGVNPLTQGGSDSLYCYGWSEASHIRDNVMGGGGASFSVENGRPWVWAMKSIRNRLWEDWQVEMQAAPQQWLVHTGGGFVYR